MHTIAELIQQKIQNLGKKEKSLNERQALLKELYEVYILENKFENYYRFLHWLKKSKKIKNEDTIKEFQKAKLPIDKKYIKPITTTYFAIKLSHIKTHDLYFLVSMKKDSINRKGYVKSSFTKWLFFSIKAK